MKDLAAYPERFRSFCPQCGPNLAVDEDGCCWYCGATATGRALLQGEPVEEERDHEAKWRRAAWLVAVAFLQTPCWQDQNEEVREAVAFITRGADAGAILGKEEATARDHEGLRDAVAGAGA